MRNKTIDAFRGLIMVLMAVDHVSYFVIKTHFYEGYDFLFSNHTLLTFLTRFITHICAPGFFFALGYGAYKKYHKSNRFTIKLLLRGCFLILLQFTIINYIWDNTIVYVGVIFVLGSTLILLNLLMPLIKRYGLYLGLFFILISQMAITQNTLLTSDNVLVRFFLVPGSYDNFYVLYVITPWLGLACIGAYLSSKKNIPYFTLSLVCLGTFMIIRLLNDFGNTHFHDSTLMSFFNLTKYPPSMAFLSLTMFINFLIMALIERFKPEKIVNLLSTFGRAALLYYVLHLALYALISNFYTSDSYIVLYSVWFVSLFVLYYPCKYLNKKTYLKWRSQ